MKKMMIATTLAFVVSAVHAETTESKMPAHIDLDPGRLLARRLPVQWGSSSVEHWEL